MANSIPAPLQLAAAAVSAALAPRCPRMVPASAVARMAESVLDKADLAAADSDATSSRETNALCYCVSALARNGVSGQLAPQRAMDLAIRALQYCGALPCSAACLPLSLP
jgi:hypothetical protein